MAPPGITPKILLTLLLVSVTMKLIEGQQQVPCLFFWGDSAFDNGNNNYIVSVARVDYEPYGIDFPDGPTGRFTNGKTIPDFLAEFMGFEEYIPPFATAKATDEILKGVNYASGAAGIKDTTGLLSGRLSLNQQLLNHAYTVSRIQLLFNDETQAKQRLNECLYMLNIGNNDFLNYFLIPAAVGFNQSSSLLKPDQFAELLIQEYAKQLMELYYHGARKLAVFGAAPLGCVPQVLKSYPASASGSLCSDYINQNLEPFNTKLKSLVDRLNTDLPDSQFVFINYTSISLAGRSINGIKVTDAACCSTVDITGLCVPDSVPRCNRNQYVFWDDYHPSQVSNADAAKRMYNASSPTYTYPMDLNHLASLKIN